ncbi:MAG: GNAT family N-acetyltransferase [Flavobacteriales bacterium]|nr:GNAT family N-acetyltransferase [Flavobacteriales bacterium]
MNIYNIDHIPELGLPEHQLPLVFSDKFLAIEAGNKEDVQVVVSDDRDILLPFFLRKSRFVKIIYPIHAPVSLTGPLTAEREQAFMERFVVFVSEKKLADKITAPLHISAYQSALSKGHATGFHVFKVNLQNDFDGYLGRLPYKARYYIRKAEKAGVEVRFGHELMESFYQVYKQHHLTEGIVPYDISYFQNMIAQMRGNCLFAICSYEGKTEGVAFVLWDKEKSYYWCGASDAPVHEGSNRLLQYRIMAYLMSLGVKEYILGGAPEGGNPTGKKLNIERFKKSLSTDSYAGWHWYVVLSPFKIRTYDMLLLGYLKMKKLIGGGQG